LRYTVIYERLARIGLPSLWMAAPNRSAVSAAANEIDRLLKSSPETCGVPFGTFRILTVPPLAVLYTVAPDDRMVVVYAIRSENPP
jgi:hypothetical protein